MNFGDTFYLTCDPLLPPRCIEQDEIRGGWAKFKYAGLSKHSPSHAQQKRNSKKAKNKGRG
jgi:hypothetical protein